MKRLILFKHVKVRSGGRCSSWGGCESEGRMWSSSWRDDLWGLKKRQRMTGRVASYNYEPSFGRRSGRIMNASLTFCCIVLSRPPLTFFWVVYGQFLHWQTHLSEQRVFILQSCLICNPDFHPPVGFECQRGNPAWRLFWYCWTLSWKTFLLCDQGCSGFRAIGSSVKTPHLITAVKIFEELKMCRVSPFFVWSWRDLIQKRIVTRRQSSSPQTMWGWSLQLFNA